MACRKASLWGNVICFLYVLISTLISAHASGESFSRVAVLEDNVSGLLFCSASLPFIYECLDIDCTSKSQRRPDGFENNKSF